MTTEPEPITNFYDNFTLIDEDAQGGYARTAEVRSLQEKDEPLRAFKVMRNKNLAGIDLVFKDHFEQRFVIEFEILQKIREPGLGPALFPRLHDSGFVRKDIFDALENFKEVPYDLPAYRTGLDLERFKSLGLELNGKSPSERWRPYLIVDLAPYNNSLFRVVRRRHLDKIPELTGRSFDFISRFGIGDILEATVKLLNGIENYHKKTGYLYWDYKPEHIYWGMEGNGQEPVLRLVDYNVPCHITKNEDGTKKDPKTIKDEMKIELRNICGAILYPALVMQTLDGNDLEPNGATNKHASDLARLRYLTGNTIQFYDAEQYLDEAIKDILRQALDPNQGFNSIDEFRTALVQYAKTNLGLDLADDGKGDTEIGKKYRGGLRDLRRGLLLLRNARKNLREGYDLADGENMNVDEFYYLLKAVDYTLEHYVLP